MGDGERSGAPSMGDGERNVGGGGASSTLGASTVSRVGDRDSARPSASAIASTAACDSALERR